MGYLDILADAVHIGGYTTYALTELRSAHQAPLRDAIANAQSQMQGRGVSGDWPTAAWQLQGLAPLGVHTISLRYEYVLHLLLTRNSPGNQSAQEAEQFMQAMQTWLHAFQQALSDFKLPENVRQDLTQTWTQAFGQGGTAAAGLGLVLALAEASSAVSCTVLIPLADPINPVFRANWGKTDLVSEPLEEPSLRIWGWDTATQEILLPGRSWAESDDPAIRGSLRHDRLTVLLRQAAAQRR